MIRFWKKDIINKMIVITLLLLIASITALIYLLFNMPQGKSLRGAVIEYLPNQVMLLVPSTGTPASDATDIALPTATFFPTMTPIPVTFTDEPTATATVTATFTLPVGKDCIPDHPSQAGKVLEILDGNTVRVLIDGLVYTVRYIGVGVSTDADQAIAAGRANTELVYAKDVILTADETDKDPSGRLLRYVLVGDLFVNLELIQSGLAPATESPGASACDQIFNNAGIATPALPTEQP